MLTKAPWLVGRGDSHGGHGNRFQIQGKMITGSGVCRGNEFDRFACTVAAGRVNVFALSVWRRVFFVRAQLQVRARDASFPRKRHRPRSSLKMRRRPSCSVRAFKLCSLPIELLVACVWMTSRTGLWPGWFTTRVAQHPMRN